MPFRRFRNLLLYCCASMPAMALLLAVPLPIRAEERVRLQSGFTLSCTGRAALPTGRVRLYLSGDGSGAGNYLDVPMAAIAEVETIPESPALVTLGKPGRHSTDKLSEIVQSSGRSHNVNTALLASVIEAESGGNANAVSRAGARGLMQLMPGTAAALHVRDSFLPDQNVNGGSAYLDYLLTRYHNDPALALAAYNAGPQAVDRYRGVPPFRETRLYVARVLRAFNRRVRMEAQGAQATAATVMPGL